MIKIIQNYDSLIGNTPLFHAKTLQKALNLQFTLLLKLEMYNPTNSIKDRAAQAMIAQAEQSGKLKKGATIIEPTSGNTGIALSALARAKGYGITLTMPETMSIERRNLLASYGAKLELTEGAKGMAGSIDRAFDLAKSTLNSFIPMQFENTANANAHYIHTGPEIWQQTSGNVDMLVAGVGTGGTITGLSKYLKQQNKNIKIVAVEPKNSNVLSGGSAGKHAIQGLGAGFIPKLLDLTAYDSVACISDDEAKAATRLLLQTEGLMCGISSGAAIVACKYLNSLDNIKGKTIVAIMPDSGQRYISTGVFEGLI